MTTTRLLVPNRGSNELGVIDFASGDGKPVAVAVGVGPCALSVDGGRYVYVADAQSDTITVVDLDAAADHPAPVHLPAGAEPVALALASVAGDRRTLCVVCAGTDRVAVFDAAKPGTLTHMGFVEVGRVPRAIALTPDQAHAVVANWGDDTVSVLPLATPPAKAPCVAVGKRPGAVLVTGTRPYAYVANRDAGTLSILDLHDPAKPSALPDAIGVGRDPRALRLSPDAGRLYVVNYGSDSLSVVDVDPTTGAPRNTQPKTVPVGRQPIDVAVSRDGRVCVADHTDRTITFVDPVTLATTKCAIVTDPGGFAAPRGVAFDHDGSRVHVTDHTGGGVVTVLANPAVAETAQVGKDPTDVAVSPDGKRVLVTCRGDATLHALHAASPKIKGTPLTVACLDDRWSYVGTRTDDGKAAVVPVDDLEPAEPIDLGAGTDLRAAAISRKEYVTIADSGRRRVVTLHHEFPREVTTVLSGLTNPVTVLPSTDGRFVYVSEAGKAVTAYELGENPTKLWTDQTNIHGLAVHPNHADHLYGALWDDDTRPVVVYKNSTNGQGKKTPIAVEFTKGKEPLSPFGIAFSPDGRHLYVTRTPSKKNGVVSVYALGEQDDATHVCDIASGVKGPTTAGVSPTGILYVANTEAGNVLAIVGPDGENPEVHTIAVGSAKPQGVALSPCGRTLYVSYDSAPGSAWELDATGYGLVADSHRKVGGSESIAGLGVSPDGCLLYTCHAGSGQAKQGSVGAFPVPAVLPLAANADPRHLAGSPDHPYVLVADVATPTLHVVDTTHNTVAATPPTLTTKPTGVVWAPGAAKPHIGYVAGDGNLVRIAFDPDAKTITPATPVSLTWDGTPVHATGIAITPDGTTLLVTARDPHRLLLVDSTGGLAPRARVDLDATPTAITVHDPEHVYVTGTRNPEPGVVFTVDVGPPRPDKRIPVGLDPGRPEWCS
ncbi:beta-propeller fold lactonase family protein [Embleya hyalina]|uniref:Uncharacterized protein n=1 Tax=Embleya hyalina TaxID=516124 RepID=A0A401Z4M0_9ACTN|nr:beta-propeller fold lactonase family protein [Embleya hyalina]GCE01785.1 hypothetical protein EHYA_09559 [Embleya hyalina]